VPSLRKSAAARRNGRRKAHRSRPGVLMLLGNNPYPVDVRVRNEATTLAEAGYEVTVLCPRWPGQERRERIDGVEVYRYRTPVRAGGVLGYMAEHVVATTAAFAFAVRELTNGGFDVLHAHNPPDTYGLVGGVFKLFGKRFVFDHHDLSPEMYDALFGSRSKRVVRRALLLLEKLSYKVADHVIATNESYREMAITRGGVPPENVTVVRNGPDLTANFSAEPDPELRARADTILAYLGVMGRQDGIDHLLRAVHHLVYDLGQPSTFCVLIGEGDVLDDLRRLSDELKIEDHVWFTGFIPRSDLLRYLTTADICVDPDPSNPFNDRSSMIKMTEYMALGKPIVAFDLPEHRFTAQTAAAYAKPNDDFDLARVIAELARDPERRAEMGRYGRRRIEEVLAWQHSVPHLLEAYEAICPVPAPLPQQTKR
jgi:glycosyltransferase involved in cell wall biosynthesis